jgi:hypothetical protein
MRVQRDPLSLSEHERSLEMRGPRTPAFVALSLLAFVWVVVAAPVGVGSGAAAYHPHIDPAEFQPAVDNPYFPLVPGTTFTFVETSGRHVSDEEVSVTHDTRTIMGVRCVVVHDRLEEQGVPVEDTFDWYAQDRQGNVWYFGEATTEFLPHGKVSTEGSWEAGVDRARPGIVMQAHPVAGAPYRQEYSPGHAEDMGQVIAIGDSVTVPYGSFAGCLRTREWSRLEPGRETKWYARGVGLVRSRSTAREEAILISVHRP